MYYRWLLTVVLLIIFAVQTHAETFTVTINADSGPGTLRDALTKAAANGEVEKDFIYFNLPDVSEAGRTIRLVSFLPAMSANMEIDGLSQLGAPFGMSSAKIKLSIVWGLTPSLNHVNAILWGTNLGNLTISGLWLTCDVNYYFKEPMIHVLNADHVTINKNLVQSGAVHVEIANELIFQSNIIGFLPDGITGFGSAVEPMDVKNTIIGGSATTGNLMSGSIKIENYTMVGPWSYKIAFNLMGVDYTGQSSSPVLYADDNRLRASEHYYRGDRNLIGEVTGEIRENVMSNCSSTVIYASGKGLVNIAGNSIGTDKTGQVNLSQFNPDYVISNPPIVIGVFVADGIKARIRGNKIAYIGSGVLEQFASEVVIESNDMYCLRNDYNLHDFYGDGKTPSVFVKITSITSSMITGKSTPNAQIELYGNNKPTSCGACDAMSGSIQTIADAQGNWSYPNSWGLNVSASAVYNNQTSYFTRPEIDITDLVVTPIDCNGLGGNLSGAVFYNTAAVKWINENGEIVANTVNVQNLPAGRYRLIAGSGICIKQSDWIEIKDFRPRIFTENMVVTNAGCGQPSSITGITATGTGTLTYSWRNGLDIEVGNTADLTNQPAGFYKLKVTDESACGPVYSEPIEITAINGVKLVTSNVSVRSSTCGLANGYIRGLQAPGATTFIWTRDDGSVAGNTLDLENIPAGNYRLTISNPTCANYADFRIDAVTPTVYPQFAATITKTCAAFPTGTITINTDGAQDQPGIFRWVDSQNNTAGFGKTIQYLPAGAYKLYLTDAGSCESFYKEYVVDSYPELKVTFGNAHDIYCGVGKGSIDAAAVSGGTGNYYYEWKDGSGTVIPGKTQAFINDIDAGTYTLSITDGGCNLAMLTYTIKEQTQIIPAPIIADVEVTRTGNTTLQVTDPFPTAIYRLYDSESSLTPLAESQGGSFTVNVTGNRSYYIGLSYGECESSRTRVRVILTILDVNIPNTFTPNGDGFNDYWTITGIEESKIATVKIFSRSGQMVFQSIGYPKPFDGTQNGKQLPSSTYYYIIEQKNAKPISGYVTILH